jgi:hypothetical protein
LCAWRGPKEKNLYFGIMQNAHPPAPSRPWLRTVLRIAAVYNILWGLWVGLFPQQFFRLLGIPEIDYPMVWQGMGMVIGVYGLGYWWAAADYIRHWPMVAVGLLGKVLGPLGFAAHWLVGMTYPQFGYALIPNDLIWWFPFGLMLWDAYRHHRAPH